MQVSIIAALDERKVIGHRSRLPWHLPGDLRHFRRLTMGRTVLMGRRTLESIGAPLEGRTNLVLTRRTDCAGTGFETVASLEEALDAARRAGTHPELWVIGGALTFALALPRTQRLHLTEVHGAHEGDAFFPDYDRSQWVEEARRAQREAHGARYSFVVYRRRHGGEAR